MLVKILHTAGYQGISNSIGETLPARERDGLYMVLMPGKHEMAFPKELVEVVEWDSPLQKENSFTRPCDTRPLDARPVSFNTSEPTGYGSRTFPSGARRDNNDHKSMPHFISPYFSERLGWLLKKGAEKFGHFNYMKGIDNEACIESLERHLLELKKEMFCGKLKGEEDHAAAIGFNIMALIHNQETSK